ncbi:cytochrome P450 CYP736A12-like [Trifolium pratense]|uniref:cytochrome P450 CYP736A12-like n=1 Tax=Trifolium pratense TaxID=57577 RepID=UPI001E695670|nr:cytochrome P450 CYP736A12-like [Trifolium pratense]
MLPQTLVNPEFLFLTIFILILLVTIFLHSKLHKKNGRKNPPGPKPLPIIGHLHMLGKLPHRTLQSLSQKYGPIMSLKLGQVQTIVVSSSQIAELFLKTHDSIFSSRPKTFASSYFSYGGKGIVFTEYGDYWRNMRKLCNIQLLHTSKVEMFAPLRKVEVGLLIKSLRKSATLHEVVHVSKVVAELIENINYKMILGRSKDDKFDLKELVHEELTLIGMFDLADYLPWLRPFDLQGIERRCKKAWKQLDEFLEYIIKEHENPSIEEQKGHNNKDFVDILLSLMNQPIDFKDKKYDIDRTNIKALIMDMISAAIDTTAVATNWALSLLLKHPNAMKKLQHELENVVGMNRQVEESDLANLPYLSMVMKETLRLFPVGPLGAPHVCLQDVVVDGYYIKKNTTVLINLWTIGRDTKVWSDNAEMFCPERFKDSNVDLRGHNFQLIPFSSGRRSCPGMEMGLTSSKLVVAQLMHCFDWELPYGMSPDNLDMSEKFELTIPKSQPLLAVPTFRLVA